MDTQWSFRKAYNEARKIMEKQDAYCAKVELGLWEDVPEEFPESLQWEVMIYSTFSSTRQRNNNLLGTGRCFEGTRQSEQSLL